MSTPDNTSDNKRTGFEIGLKDPAKICAQAAQAGYAWAEADGAASLLEENKKSKLAQLILKYMHTGSTPGSDGSIKQLSRIEAETRALADDDYIEYVNEMVAKREESNKLRVRYDMSKTLIDLERSREATLRAEMKL